jgi:hypothetical protein
MDGYTSRQCGRAFPGSSRWGLVMCRCTTLPVSWRLEHCKVDQPPSIQALGKPHQKPELAMEGGTPSHLGAYRLQQSSLCSSFSNRRLQIQYCQDTTWSHGRIRARCVALGILKWSSRLRRRYDSDNLEDVNPLSDQESGPATEDVAVDQQSFKASPIMTTHKMDLDLQVRTAIDIACLNRGCAVFVCPCPTTEDTFSTDLVAYKVYGHLEHLKH